MIYPPVNIYLTSFLQCLTFPASSNVAWRGILRSYATETE